MRETPELGDCVLARILDDPQRSQSGTVARTYAYMSPEQLAGRGVECTSDLYSLGVLLYELLPGRLPFQLPALVGLVFVAPWARRLYCPPAAMPIAGDSVP